MTFEVEVAGRMHIVSIEPAGPTDSTGGRFHVASHRADEPPSQAQEIDVRRTAAGVAVLREGSGESLDVAITERAGGECLVQIRGVSLPAVVDGRRSRRQHGSGDQGAGEQRVTAPMPGRIVRVMVKTGDEVVARQGLVVIEAMKMENELTSLRAGRVVEVAVSEGASVEAGRLLVRIE